MHKPLMSLLEAIDDESETLCPRREDVRKLVFLIGPRVQPGRSTLYDHAVLRGLSTMVGQPILLNGGWPGGI